MSGQTAIEQPRDTLEKWGIDAAPVAARYSVGEVARLAGVSPSSIRLWERMGLISAGRTVGGHRVYGDGDLDRIQRIAYLRRFERLNAAAIRRELGPAPVEPDAEPAVEDHGVGARLRALRLASGLALSDAADRSGLSISFLSAVERGESGISLGSLFKLADAYGTTVPRLQHGTPPSNQEVVHPRERPRYLANRGRVLIEDLITQVGALEAQRIEIAPGGGSEEAYAHPGEEFVYVLAGQLTFWLDERQEQHTLNAGDSLYIQSTRLHHWRNDGSVTTHVLWVNAPRAESGSNTSRSPDRP